MLLDVFETWGFRDFNNDSPVHVNEMMQDQKPVILPHGFLYFFFAFTCTRVSALSARWQALSQQGLGWPLRRWIVDRFSRGRQQNEEPTFGNFKVQKNESSTFFFWLERRFYAPKSGEIEPVLEDRSGTDFLPETGCFFGYRYFDGTLGVGCLCPMFFRWQAQLVWCIGSVHWKHLVFPTFSKNDENGGASQVHWKLTFFCWTAEVSTVCLIQLVST